MDHLSTRIEIKFPPSFKFDAGCKIVIRMVCNFNNSLTNFIPTLCQFDKRIY